MKDIFLLTKTKSVDYFMICKFDYFLFSKFLIVKGDLITSDYADDRERNYLLDHADTHLVRINLYDLFDLLWF